MSCRTFVTRPVFLEPTVTCSQPRSEPTTSTVRSTVRCSSGATVTGTTLIGAGPLGETPAPAGEHPERLAATAPPSPAAISSKRHGSMISSRTRGRAARVEALQQVAHKRAGPILPQGLVSVEEIEGRDDDHPAAHGGAGIH